jgi:hypothetical protein
MGITEFLEARISEDEQVARAATAGPWTWEEDQPMDESFLYGLDDIPVVVAYGMHTPGFLECSDEDRTHIAAHDPARVLAECAAKRKAIQEMSWIHGDPWEYGAAADAATSTLHALAAVYSDHPDYQQEWAA